MDVLPALSLGNKNEAYKQKSEALKTGTDDQPVNAYKPAYKKLTKNAYSGCQHSSITVSENMVISKPISDDSNFDKSLEIAQLGNKKNSLSTSVNSEFRIEAEGARTLNLRIDSPML